MRHEFKDPLTGLRFVVLCTEDEFGVFDQDGRNRLACHPAILGEILRLAERVERKHRKAAERQRDDKAEEIRCLRAEREKLMAGRFPEVASRIQALEEENQRLRLDLARLERAENPLAKYTMNPRP